jgi:phosphotransferase system IIB component
MMANRLIFLWMAAWVDTWVFYLIVGAVVISAGVGVFFILRKPAVKTKVLSNEIIEEIIRNLGGIPNISKVSQDGARMKFEVADVNLCHLDDLRLNGAVGVFVSGHAVKFILANKADRLIEQISEMKKRGSNND